jgi:N-sulfoglucosamine sulfohydrolase
MNILYFHTHDSGRYFRHYGYADAPTEFISRWALENALTFRNAFSCAPTCSPSRASLMTGTYPHTNGMLGLAHRGFSMNDYNRHLVAFMKEHGYHTVLCGVQHEAAGCFDHERGAARVGYAEDITADLVRQEPDSVHHAPDGDTTAAWDRENTSRAVEWLSSGEERSGGTPFFLSLGLYATHRVFPSLPPAGPKQAPPQPRQSELPGLPELPGVPWLPGLPGLPGVPDTEETRRDHARFLEALRGVDGNFARVIGALELGGHGEDTIVLFTTDHGVAQPFSKCNLNAHGQGVALMVRVPGTTPPRPFCDAMVSTIDLFPTLADLLGLKTPAAVQGRSFSRLLREPEAEHREYIFGEVNYHTSYEPMRSVRNRRYNLVKNYDRQYPRTHLSNIDDSPAKSVLLARGLARETKVPVELYDLERDPLERENVIDDPRYRATAETLERILLDWQQDTGDPLLQGEIAPPPGTIVNRPECVDPDSPEPGDYVNC